ncbi:MAG: hypothetical protein IH840_16685 [Candidatus Heimdallarchaeota archaeon]|nr:hypothetical protein [Candidatus Heimdallarchaeota archaeon]
MRKILGCDWEYLIEIIYSEKTSQKTIATINELSIALGKQPINVKDFPGFASSRLGVVIGLEAIRWWNKM